MKHILILTLLVASFNSELLGQEVIEAKDYHPLTLGSKWKYSYVNSSNSMTFKVTSDNVKKLNNTFYKLQISYSWGSSDEALYRFSDGTLMLYDEDRNIEVVTLPKNPIKGEKWTHNDGWEFEIMDTIASLKTPSDNYQNLIKVKATQVEHNDKEKGEEYFLFYAKGIGQVGSYMDGKLQTYLSKYKIK